MTRKVPRDIADINDELRAALRHEAYDTITIGALLIEAKEQLVHGEWLPWLKVNFGSTVQAAENYMAAARFETKFKPGLNLKLRAHVYYLLGREMENRDTVYGPKVIAAILKAAETEWINVDRAREIAASMLRPPPPKPKTQTKAEREAEQRALAARRAAEQEAARKRLAKLEAARRKEQEEIDKLLDGPPPALPPAPEATAPSVILPPFDAAIAALLPLQTKPLASFVGTTHSPDRIQEVALFLQQVGNKPPPKTDDAEPDEKIGDLGVDHLEAEIRKLQAANAMLRAEPGHTPELAPEVAGLLCSFCSKTNDEVATLVQGNQALICNECVALCADIIVENARIKAAKAGNRSLVWSGDVNDVTGLIARCNGSELSYVIKRISERSDQCNVVIYEEADQSRGQRLNKKPYPGAEPAVAAVEADYAERSTS